MRGRFVPLVIYCVSGGLISGHGKPLAAAENLPPLRVDPALLGAPPRPSPPQEQPEVKPAPPPPEPEMKPPEPGVKPPELEAKPITPPEPPAPQALPPSAPTPAAQEPGPRSAPGREGPPGEPAVPAESPASAPATPTPSGQPERAAPAAPGTAAPGQAPAVPATEREAPPPSLRLSPRLVPLPRSSREPRPTFLSADRIRGNGPNETVAEGNVELRRIGNTLFADRLTYWQDEDEVEAVGNVLLTQDQDRISGPKLRLKIEQSIGYFETPTYAIKHPPKADGGRAAIEGSGHAERLNFEGQDLFRLNKATYSTCGPDNPDWYAQAGDLFLDYTTEVGQAKDAKVVFKGVPIMYSPWLDFSLNNQRKSGILPPTLGTSTRTGLTFMLPYYWNIAPNMDATIAPRLMSRRGLQLNGEFRYLESSYNGIVHGEYLPKDLLLDKGRGAYSWQHTQTLPYGFAASLDVNGVSDDTYFSDLATRSAVTSQTNLLRQGVLSYGGGWWSAQAIVQRFQTLQDPALPPVGKPYDKLPQLLYTANRPDLRGFAFAMTGDFTAFDHPTLDTGRRLVLYPQVSYPLENAYSFLRPKLGLHFTEYNLQRTTSTGPDAITRTLPIASVDAGLIFDRRSEWFGKALTQTLEPRLYYLYVPNRNQDQIPIFDTALADYNFAQIFSENIFTGSDRIADANQITAAVVSRLLDDNGVELIRGALGQRYHFRNQTVTIPGVPARTSHTADLLAALSGRIGPRFLFDTAWEYNPNDQTTQRMVVGGRYQPGFARVLSAGYRFQKDVLKEIDVTGQWPLFGRWYGVGRYNFSLFDRRLIESLAGVEYNGGCWVARFLVQRFATATQTTNTAFFVQLELNGFSSIGSNPLELLKRSIPGYGRINQSTADPVFGAN